MFAASVQHSNQSLRSCANRCRMIGPCYWQKSASYILFPEQMHRCSSGSLAGIPCTHAILLGLTLRLSWGQWAQAVPRQVHVQLKQIQCRRATAVLAWGWTCRDCHCSTHRMAGGTEGAQLHVTAYKPKPMRPLEALPCPLEGLSITQVAG